MFLCSFICRVWFTLAPRFYQFYGKEKSKAGAYGKEKRKAEAYGKKKSEAGEGEKRSRGFQTRLISRGKEILVTMSMVFAPLIIFNDNWGAASRYWLFMFSY